MLYSKIMKLHGRNENFKLISPKEIFSQSSIIFLLPTESNNLSYNDKPKMKWGHFTLECALA